jgi:hypothetical protein
MPDASPVPACQSRMVVSKEPEAMVPPSGENVTELTGSV